MFYLGMDVAKAKLDCCLLLDEASGRRKTKVASNAKSGIVDLLAWVAKQNVSPGALHVVMEATGVYHEQAAMALADAGITVSIVNPAQVKDFGRGLAVRTKTDGVDSFVLARYGALLKPVAWTPPAPEARMLQALLSRREAITHDFHPEPNPPQKAHPPRRHECCKRCYHAARPSPRTCSVSATVRSEERRVGKECRTRGAP